MAKKKSKEPKEEVVETPVETEEVVVEEETEEEAPVEEPKKIIIPKEPEEEPAPEPEEEQEEEVVEEPEPEKEPKEPDLKEKLSASARENQRILAKDRVITQAIAEADDIPEPTEEEMTQEFKDWEVMSDLERTLARETVITRRWRGKIRESQQKAEKIVKWEESVDEFTDDPKTLNEYPDLEGKTDEFKEFAKKETSNSVPFNILIGAFLHEKTQKPTKGSMFIQGSGGPNSKGKGGPAKLTVEDGRKLRETDYSKWKEMLKAGKIESGIEE
jgi:chemotaxis protein histidine kinase CheA